MSVYSVNSTIGCLLSSSLHDPPTSLTPHKCVFEVIYLYRRYKTPTHCVSTSQERSHSKEENIKKKGKLFER